MRRRDILGAGTFMALGAPFGLAAAQAAPDSIFDGMEEFAPLPSDFRPGLGAEKLKLSPNFGSSPPPALYKDIARSILVGAPVACRPIDVAYYFNNVRMGQLTVPVQAAVRQVLAREKRLDLLTTDFVRLFAFDWEHSNYFNPVVLQFLTGIGVKPYAGDATPWCAAFANWCISRAQSKNPSALSFTGAALAFGTRSASSGSFRCWGAATQTPREGDIVVWAKNGTQNAACPIVAAEGHVGFFCRIETAPNGAVRYVVLGGNQGFVARKIVDGQTEVTQRDIAQAVSLRRIGQTFSDRAFHSIRTSPLLGGGA